jgi:hypothetical protein
VAAITLDQYVDELFAERDGPGGIHRMEITLKERPGRCKDYWGMYDKLLKLNRQWGVAFRENDLATAIIIRKEMDVIAKEMSQHMACCEQCQRWLKSFEPKF